MYKPITVSASDGRFVFASTCSNYGKMEDLEKYVDEDAELRPVSYAETKVAMEREVLNVDVNRGMRSMALRFVTVFGVLPRVHFDLTMDEFTLRLLVRTASLR